MDHHQRDWKVKIVRLEHLCEAKKKSFRTGGKVVRRRKKEKRRRKKTVISTSIYIRVPHTRASTDAYIMNEFLR